MMEEMNKWLSAHKQLCVITGIFGLLVSPFLWPVFLAVIIQSLSLVIPVAAGLFFYEKFIMKKDKEETNENDDDNKQQKNHAGTKRKALSGSRRFGKLWNLKIETVFQ